MIVILVVAASINFRFHLHPLVLMPRAYICCSFKHRRKSNNPPQKTLTKVNKGNISVLRAQRFLLYALDELAMAALRMRIRVPGEGVKPHEAHFKLHEEEVPVKNKVRGCCALLVPSLHHRHLSQAE